MDGLGKPEPFSKVFRKLVESYVLDAIDWFEPEKEHKNLTSEVIKFMRASHSAEIESRPSVGLGTDLRLESKKVTGFALLLDDKILHLCIFTRANSQGRKTAHPVWQDLVKGGEKEYISHGNSRG